ncbi:hypothetical protein KAU43_08755 [candidate division WOR-3 bacterium]|nr:hypothetical protein [candidate division WOR-3 bacterium]
MNFKLYISDKAKEQIKDLKYNKGFSKQYKAVKKTLSLLENNPMHPSLQSHRFYSLKGPNGEKVFEAYAEQNTPAAYHMFFYYGPDKREISIISIEHHPD